jgi:hypothetical protein
MSAQRVRARSAAAPRHDNGTASGRITNQVVEEFRYLAPSVNTIMTAGRNERGQLHGIDAFRVSLVTPRAPMCEPGNAIAAGRTVDGTD